MVFVCFFLFSCSIPPIPHCLSLTWRSCWGYFCKHLEFSASLLALFDASEKVHFTPEPSCIAPSLDLTLDHTSIMQSKYHLFETVNYKSWTSGAVFSIQRLSRLRSAEYFLLVRIVAFIVLKHGGRKASLYMKYLVNKGVC